MDGAPPKPKRARRPKPAATALPSREALLDFLRTHPGKTGRREIAKAFGITGAARIDLKRLVGSLGEAGETAGPRRALRAKGALPPVAVIVITGLDGGGMPLGRPLDWTEAEGEPPVIRIGPGKGPPPGIGDHVLAKLTRETNSMLATPIRILPRRTERALAVFRAEKTGGGWLIPTDRKALKEWRLDAGQSDGAQDGELVRFEVLSAGRSGRASARVMERLGRPDGPHAVSRIAAVAHGIREEFPGAALDELKALPKLSLRGREDLRYLPLVTIDPEDARDHDDAVFAEAAGNGHRLLVAIADVSFYVRPGSALDDEARARGNSTYFPDRVIPMLPETISNDLCSLREGEDRPCIVCEMHIDAAGTKSAHRFFRATMRSAAKLHYAEAQAAIDGTPSPRAAPLIAPLRALWAAYAALKTARDKRSPLDLDLPERRIVFGPDGTPGVVLPVRLDAHRLIEEFMISANVAAAEALEAARLTLPYRIHDSPSPERLAALAEFLATIGVSFPKAGTVRPAQFNRVLGRLAGAEYAELANTVVLRSQAQAEYSPANIGHFGLNLARYAHFTSPIRRYADLLVHRALVKAGKLGLGGLEDAEIAALPATAEHISAAERRSMAAERETLERLIAQHLAGHIGAGFAARISGVNRVGLFVKLTETGAEGFIPAAGLGNDYFAHDTARHALIGRRTGETYRLGDSVEVRLVEVRPEAGAMRFEMLTAGTRRPAGSAAPRGAMRRPALPKRSGGR